MYGDSEYWACSAQRRSTASWTPSRLRFRSICRSSSARFSSRSVRTRSSLALTAVLRAIYEIDPPEAAETLALIESVGRADGPSKARARVVDHEDGRAVLEFPVTNFGGDVTLLVSSLLAGEWADAAVFSRCRLVGMEWPAGLLPGPAFDAPEKVLVGAIVKPSLGLSPAEVAATAKQLAAGGADLIKDDELLGDPPWCPLDERVSAVAAVLPDGVRYAPNVTGPVDSLLERAGPRRRARCGCGDGERLRPGPRFTPRAARGGARRADLRPPRRRGALGQEPHHRRCPGCDRGAHATLRRRLRPGRLVHRNRLRHPGGSARTDRRVSPCHRDGEALRRGARRRRRARQRRGASSGCSEPGPA